jgi:hypothetical protein
VETVTHYAHDWIAILLSDLLRTVLPRKKPQAKILAADVMPTAET